MLTICSVFALPVAAFASHDYQMAYHPTTYTTYPTTYYTPTIDRQATINALLAQIAVLQAQLQRMQAQETNNNSCYTVGTARYCYTTTNNTGYNNYNTYGNTDARSISVEYKNNAAYVTINYRNGSNDDFVFATNNNAEVVDFIVQTTHLDRSNINAAITFSKSHSTNSTYYNNNRDGINTITVTIDTRNNDARARVRYNDGTTRSYSYSTDVKSRIITDLADDLNISENTVNNLAVFSYSNSRSNVNSNTSLDNISTIRITINVSSADVRVRYDNNSNSNYTYYTTSKSTILDRLSRDLDVNRSDLSDFIIWN